MDTLFLSRTSAAPATNLLPVNAPLRRGPSSAEAVEPETLWGWRVQLASSPARKALEELVQSVEREFGSAAYLEDHDGVVTLRIGAFTSLQAAQRERDRAVTYGYKNAWIVQTPIPLHQFNHQE